MEVTKLNVCTGNVLCVRWSPDGQYLASGSDDMVAIVWEKDESVAHFLITTDVLMLDCRNGHGRKVFGQVEENHEVWKPVRRLVGHESGKDSNMLPARSLLSISTSRHHGSSMVERRILAGYRRQ
jgi:protein HIRA/HIR1